MKKRILLVDESLTVQKVVALTLDKGRYQVSYARTRQEVIKSVVDLPPHLILLSDTVNELNAQTFPKELEAWLGRNATVPPVVLITNQDIREMKHYTAVLKKPFTPQNLQALVESQVEESNDPSFKTDPGRFMGDEDLNNDINDDNNKNDSDELRLEKAFNESFSNEDSLVRETFSALSESQEPENDTHTMIDVQGPKNRAAEQRRAQNADLAHSLWENTSRVEPEDRSAQRHDNQSNNRSHNRSHSSGTKGVSASELWGVNEPVHHNQSSSSKETRMGIEAQNQVLGAEDSMAYKSVLESEVHSRLEKQDLEEMVAKALQDLMPPIVEKLVTERLDRLLKEHEQSSGLAAK